MLCKLDGGTIYPLPQSVFANSEGWNIMVEPEFKYSRALMQLTVRVEGDAVLMGASKLKAVSPAPHLINNPREPQRGSP